MWETILGERDRKGLVEMADRTKAEPVLDRHVEYDRDPYFWKK